ncbi:phage scaffolding protein [Clostridium algidicarnis]|uniref:phage scaffolding protein n=1 Tax=Clostridium algidicarnis TaxID=37659 RepID=UPI001C0AA8F6|nr:phage scaffolding protein [Clostridium algidicarnis]MBU3208696.1 phage scaffolding protein [Clostridium algidicarnis]
MEWLKKLLEGSTIKDGKLDIEGLMKAINTEFPKNAVPKDKYNEVSEAKKQLETDIKERDTQLETLKKSTGDSEGLKNQIETLQADNQKKDQEYQEQLKDLKVTNAIKLAVADKAQDTDLVAGLFDKSKLILGDDGKITGLEDQLKSLQESKTFLFKQEETKQETQPGFKIGVDGTPQNGEANSQLASIFGNDSK